MKWLRIALLITLLAGLHKHSMSFAESTTETTILAINDLDCGEAIIAGIHTPLCRENDSLNEEITISYQPTLSSPETIITELDTETSLHAPPLDPPPRQILTIA